MSASGPNGVDVIFKVVGGHMQSQVLFTACELGIFDILAKDGGGKTAVQLAADLSTDADGTERLLNACVSLGFLKKSLNADKKGVFSNSEIASNHLTSNSEVSLKGWITFANLITWPLFTNLEHAVREGTDQVSRTFGVSGKQFYKEKFFKDEASTKNFMDGMHGLSLATSPSVVKAFDFSEFKTVCDFGGGTGALAYELCRVYPEMSIKVLELPPVAKVAAKYFEPKDGKSAKVEFVPGDFFEKELPAADMYIFSQVFHNWQEDKIHQLLKKAHKALKPGGAVLLVEHLFNNDKTGPPPVAVRCLLMLLGSEGRERNKEEYTKLLEVNGFKDVQFKPSGVLQTAILARRL